jgi:hypothetical protein
MDSELQALLFLTAQYLVLRLLFNDDFELQAKQCRSKAKVAKNVV